ncbi:hypothetical protein [Alteribacter populi]|uniref:hypothetical protein n=1 Tax=Alteribacter populi TaxID=2011011 RepID=UPI000BBB0787|nr:hypothetical protein [Alteribacter populi]
MLERFIRSPISMMLFFAALIGVIYMVHYQSVSNNVESVITLCFLILALVFIVLILFHNKRNPDRRISWKSWTPYELKEEDEGQQWVTFRACRKVYIFYYFALPIGAAVIAFTQHVAYMPLVVLLAMGVIQYTIYWLEERKYLNQQEEVEE